MENIIFLVPCFPLIGFIVLSIFGRHLNKMTIASIGAGSIVIPALLVIIIGIQFLSAPPSSGAYIQTLWRWIGLSSLIVDITLRVDALSMIFIFIISFVGALIHIYSVAFMRADNDYARFFACMNLFVFSMLVLVMADNLLLLYLGWEGVGLCSYLLIGFWYQQPSNSNAANKAFYITRIGDTAMAIGLFLLFMELGSLDIPQLLKEAPANFVTGSYKITLITILLLIGGMGKSAQLPLQTWLPDAMAGPSPVSALIHAATMVTAGVYLIARMYALFQLSPVTMTITAIIGAITLFIAGSSALVQTDIKRILAYSTISQVGYMFLALGVGAWSAAIFHFFTHAFFKALLFLAAGIIIECLHHEHNIFRMGGLRKKLPVVYAAFIAGAASLAALPFISSGFFSKDQVLWYAWSAGNGHPIFWLLGWMGAFITALYTARLVIIVFFGKMHTPVSSLPGPLMQVPILILAVLSIIAGYIEWPHNISHISHFSDILGKVLPSTTLKQGVPAESLFQVIAIITTLAGVYTGYYLYSRQPGLLNQWTQSSSMVRIKNFLLIGWGFDKFYHMIFVRPFIFISTINKSDVIDKIPNAISRVGIKLNSVLSNSQNGSLRWYVAGVLIGILFILSLQFFV